MARRTCVNAVPSKAQGERGENYLEMGTQGTGGPIEQAQEAIGAHWSGEA